MNHLIDSLRHADLTPANALIKQTCGIVDFFSSETDKEEFIAKHEESGRHVCENRASYGDWQTPPELASAICEEHLAKYGMPDIAVEPTCGVGAFVMAALDIFTELSELHAIEINRNYVTDLKYRILSQAVNNPRERYPDIYIYTADVFTFDFSTLFKKALNNGWQTAIVGNPPWVTNSRQGKTNSQNVPTKQNAFRLKGIDAITGKSNFDISEYITLNLLRAADGCKGAISFLLKNSVVRNIVEKQHHDPLCIGKIEQETIDADKEFDVAVDASCLSAQLGCEPEFCCKVRDFYTAKLLSEFGWQGNAFVSDMRAYRLASQFDGAASYEWRSGIKHDCAPVLELTLKDGQYINGLGERVDIEESMIFPLLKSSDINKEATNNIRKFIILPQRRTRDDTSALKTAQPLAYDYLSAHDSFFAKRKSRIYKGKERFSIFGIGDYSFKPYKIVVSSLYKKVRFLLVEPYNGRPVMVDDTCYQLGFDSYDEAKRIYDALQSDEIQSLINSIVFYDAKRVVTKNILMRINLDKYLKNKEKTGSTTSHRQSWQQLSLFK